MQRRRLVARSGDALTVAVASTVLGRAAVLVLCGLAAMPSVGAGRPEGPMPSTCFWYGPYVKENPELNIGFPDTGAVYWSSRMSLPEGARVVLRGAFAHARYQSLSAYRADGSALDGLRDTSIVPDEGSRNPFLPDNRSTGRNGRLFTVEVVDKAVPATGRRQNTLYAASGTSGRQILFLRIYVPDEGRDLTGGVGLPIPELHLADGTVLQGEAVCSALGINHSVVPIPFLTPAQYGALRDKQGAPSGFPARNPPEFLAFYNPQLRSRCLFSLNPKSDCYPTTRPERAGGMYPNLDSSYMTLYASRRFGEVLVLRGKLPTTPLTYRRNSGGQRTQLRYWSICQTESLATTATEGCLYDEQIPLDGDRNYVIVTSLLGDRPANASTACGVGYLPWPPDGDGAGHRDDSYIFVRNMLPADDFRHAIQNTRIPGDEAEVLGPYLPRAEYMSTRDFEALGCRQRVSPDLPVSVR